MDIDTILLEAEEAMQKAVDYIKNEMKGLRTGRASPALIEFVKVDYYGAMTELRQLALISVPEATQLLVKPYDAGSVQAINKAIQDAGLGLNPQVDGKQLRINLPPLSGDRRQQLVNEAKKYGEDAKVTIRNARRDANKHLDQLGKDKTQHLSEDEIKTGKEEVQDLTKKYESSVDNAIDAKSKEILQV